MTPNMFRLREQISRMSILITCIFFNIVLIESYCSCNSAEIDKFGGRNFSLASSGLHPKVLEHLFFVELNSHIKILGNVSDKHSYLKRTFLDDGHKRASTLLEVWMHQAGLSTWVDSFRNVRGRYEGPMGSPAILIGSHYDTVIDGGIYDGAMGILVGVAAVKAVLLEAAVAQGVIDNNRLLFFLEESDNDLDCSKIFKDHRSQHLITKSLEIVAFSDEEGVRFQSTFLGSRGLTGYFSKNTLSNIVDAHGQTLLDVLRQVNRNLTVDDILKTAASRKEFAGYVEVHIEQGPVLEKQEQALGVVSGIAGQSRVSVSILGEQGHAGTVPMKLRKDPMAGAAYLIQFLERLCLSIAGVGDAKVNPKGGKDLSLVCTVGSLNLWPDASNVIPGVVNFTVDIRSLSDSSRNDVLDTFQAKVVSECSTRKLICSLEMSHTAKSVSMDQDLTQYLDAAIQLSQEQNGTCRANAKTLALPSGAGHDALAISEICPVAMMFVRCRNGVSHHPDEFVDPHDVHAAAKATYHFIKLWLGANMTIEQN